MRRPSPLWLIPLTAALASVPFVLPHQERPAPTQAQTAPATPPDYWNQQVPQTAPQSSQNQYGNNQSQDYSGTQDNFTTQPSTTSSQSLQAVYQQASASAVRVNVGDSAIGSGFFITSGGRLMTAAHVVLEDPGADLSVTLADGSERPAQVVGYDQIHDLAVLQVQGSGFTALPLAKSAAQVGEQTVAIGNSRGDFDAGRAGQVTALGARLDASFAPNLTASSMPLAPGDSGGPVLNMQGEVVGVSDAISEANGQFSSYFVPLTRSSSIVGQLQAGLKSSVPILGVTVADAQQQLGQPGALITGVTNGLGAAQAGLEAATVSQVTTPDGQVGQQIGSADVIVGVDGQSVQSPDDLIGYLRGKRAGDTVNLTVQRGGQTLRVPVTLSPGVQL